MIKKETKKEIKRLMQIEGDVKGEVLRASLKYLEDKTGKQGIKKIEEGLSSAGYPLKYNEIDSFKWYKEAYSVSIYLLCLEVLGWTEKDIREMGENAPRLAPFIVMFLNKFVSVNSVFKESSTYWRKHLNFGDIIPLEIDEEKKRIRFKLEGYKFNPITDYYLSGYFLGILRFCIRSKQITIEQTKSVYKDDPYNEYLVLWV